MSTDETNTARENEATNSSENSSATAVATAQTAAPEPPDQPQPTSDAREDDERRTPSEDFGQLLDQFEQEQSALQEGEVVRGTVVGITERGVLIDFGHKSEGIVNPSEFMENGELAVKRGDEVDVLVKAMETSEGFPVLSRADAVRLRAWDDVEKAFNEGTPIKGRVIDRIKGGVRVDIDGIAAFLPGSQVDTRPIRNLDSLRGKEIEAKIIKLNRKRSNVVLSRKAVLEEQNADRKGATLGQIEEDIIVEGQIHGGIAQGAEDLAGARHRGLTRSDSARRFRCKVAGCSILPSAISSGFGGFMRMRHQLRCQIKTPSTSWSQPLRRCRICISKTIKLGATTRQCASIWAAMPRGLRWTKRFQSSDSMAFTMRWSTSAAMSSHWARRGTAPGKLASSIPGRRASSPRWHCMTARPSARRATTSGTSKQMANAIATCSIRALAGLPAACNPLPSWFRVTMQA